MWAASFAWPAGGIWSNLLASVVWTVPAIAWQHRRQRRHTAAQTAEIKQHITDTAERRQP